jgi:hypothetical protein
MPITGPSSYPPTINTFVTHWTEVNSALGAGNELTLAEGITLADLTAHGEELVELRDGVTDAGVDRSLARELLNNQITALQARLVEFNEKVRADMPGSAYERILPVAFAVGDAEGTVRDTLRQMRTLWGKINAISPVPTGLTLPMVLRGGYTQAMLGTDLDSLRQAYTALTTADQALKLARELRNDKQDVIYPILKNYRLKVPTKFPEGDALVDSLPALTPASGSTPAAVTAHGAWDAASTQAKITWNASTDAALEHYEVRGVPGDSYTTDDEVVLATVEPSAAREFVTDFALGTPGLTAGFKVYVVSNTGNEKGSEAVYVTRPA